jgi:hypothetical protein
MKIETDLVCRERTDMRCRQNVDDERQGLVLAGALRPLSEQLSLNAAGETDADAIVTSR